MKRRDFLRTSLSALALSAAGAGSAAVSFAAAPPGANYRRLLVLIELKGGNDGLNTVVPYADPDGAGNPGCALDFRSVYATLLERWWGVPAQALGGEFEPVPFVAA